MGKRFGGRQKGTPNIITRDIKEMALSALSNVGGDKYLTAQAVENPVAFMGLLGKILPKEVQLNINAKISEMSPEERIEEARAIIERLKSEGKL